jgi:hypothetical protein
MLHQLLYVSVETSPYTKDELISLLKQSREKNARLGVTGILLYFKKHFFQVLEGEKDVIFDLFRLIKQDERHTSVILMHDQTLEERHFKDWTMAFINLNEIDKCHLEGFSGFLEKDFTCKISQQHLTLAEELLLKFKSSL